MKILLIEDEALTARKLQRLLSGVKPEAEVVGVTGSIEESVVWLQTHASPDLILMDIELSDGQSFDIFQRVSVACPVIFTTAYDEYAIKAFKVNSIDYLLKPVREDDLRKALDKLHDLKQILTGSPDALQATVNKLLEQLAPPPPVHYRDRFMIKQGQRLFFVGIEQVAYFFTRQKISFIKTYEGHEWMIDYTLDEIDKMVDHRRFFRLNRQIIAALPAVEKVHLYFNHKLKVHLKPPFNDEILVSREKAKDFKVWLGE